MRRYLSASPPGYGRCPCVMHIARPARGRTIESGLRKAATAPLTKQMATHAASAELRRRRNLKTVSACFLCLRPTPPCVVLISTTIATNHCCQYGSRVIPYAASQSPHTHSHKPARHWRRSGVLLLFTSGCLFRRHPSHHGADGHRLRVRGRCAEGHCRLTGEAMPR